MHHNQVNIISHPSFSFSAYLILSSSLLFFSSLAFSLTIQDPDALKCRAFGPGLENGVSGERTQFTVEVRNRHDQVIAKAGFPIDVDIYNPKRDLVENTKVVDNQGNIQLDAIPLLLLLLHRFPLCFHRFRI